jgi:hypothetical protein
VSPTAEVVVTAREEQPVQVSIVPLLPALAQKLEIPGSVEARTQVLLERV